MKRTGIVWEERFCWHDTRNGAGILTAGEFVEPFDFVEGPDAKRRIYNLLCASGFIEKLHPIKAEPASTSQLLSFHEAEYVNQIRLASDALGGEAGFVAPYGPGSYDVARLAVGGLIAALDAVLRGDVENAYALIRPAGHHAMPNQGIGFCIFANGVIAAKHAMSVHRVEKIAIVDWDVHHGNSAEYAFYDRSDVLTISVHQDSCFPPSSGKMSDNGSEGGQGYNINVPLPPGSGTGAYLAAFDRVIEPALTAFNPDLIIVPSGLDAGAFDPLGRMLMYSDGFREMTKKMVDVAELVCDGSLVLCHEGGYWGAATPFDALAIFEALSGVESAVVDPHVEICRSLGGQELQPHQDKIISDAQLLVEKLIGLEG